MKRLSAFNDSRPVSSNTHTSGVHEAPTQPAPYVEEAPSAALIGSIPLSEVTVLFQPLVALASGQTLGFEAVPRCQLAELSDLEELYARAVFEKKVGELGRHLRAVALRECLGTPVYIDVHPNELKESWLIRPDDPMCGHDAEVFLEIGQSQLSEVALQVLAEVGSRSGISLVLDDLGAGVSNFKQLLELKPAAVKIDASLINGCDRSRSKQKVLRGLAAMCDDLGVRVIAKGVDSEAELQAVAGAGIQYGQGYVLGAPAPLPMVSNWPPPVSSRP
jgi:EAL domain-containing protein (putative c-di-GMP-specific phosphodiesterase class I)